ncbi:MAG: hypothetical protein ABSB35_18035 [Bryobacteraceae bacterium]|jgi:hypothetical protein
MTRLIPILLPLATGLVAFAQNYNPCSNPVQQYWCDSAPAGSDITLLSATLTPDPIKKGEPVSLTFTTLD